MVVVPDTVEIDIGRLDTEFIELNRWACEPGKSPKDLVIVEGASHLFKEPGTLKRCSATRWVGSSIIWRAMEALERCSGRV